MGIVIHVHNGAQVRTIDFMRGDLVTESHNGSVYAGHPLAEVSQAAMNVWAAQHGFAMKPEAHVTTAASRKPVDLRRIQRLAGGMIVPPGGRTIEQFGDHIVMCLACDELQRRHDEYKKAGASWDFPTYRPHITLGRAVYLPPVADITPFDEPLTLGPEAVASFDDY